MVHYFILFQILPLSFIPTLSLFHNVQDKKNDLALGAMQKGSLDLNGCIVGELE